MHPVLLGGLYVLTSFQQIYPFCSTVELVQYLVPTLGLIWAGQLLIRQFYPDRFKSAVLASIFTVLFFFFGDIRMQLEKLLSETPCFAFTRLRYMLVTVGCLWVVLSWGVIRSRRSFLVLSRYLNAVSTAMIAVTIGQLLMTSPVPSVPVGPKAHVPLQLPPNPPDVYYILTDAYTSSESLQKYWNFDNSAFVDALTREGFRVVKNAQGNGDFTPRCLATSLNMDYPPRLAPTATLPERVKYLCHVIETAEVPARFKASGYKITALSLFATAGEPRFYMFPIIGSTTFGEYLMTKTAAGYLNSYRTRTRFGDTNLKIASLLSKIPREKIDQPRFVYAHLMMPHEPFFFDRNGNRVKRGMNASTVRKEDYLDQLIFENSLLTNVVSEIIKNSKTPPIIIVQGDHGFRHLPIENRREESTTILNALYLPGASDDWIYDGMTPVNTFRMIFNRYFGEHYEYLPDKQLFYLNSEHE